MSLVINAFPDNYSSFNDDLVYTVSDNVAILDPVTYPNFKFIGDVYVNGVLVARIKKIPDPVTGIGIFNIGQIVRNYAAMVFNPAAGIVSQTAGNGQFNLDVQMAFGEDYGYTNYLNITLDSVRAFFNNYNGRLKGQRSSLTLLADKIVSNNLSLSGQALYSSNYYFVPYFPIGTGAVNFIVTPTGGGVGYATTFTPANPYDLQILNISPGGLNAVHPGTIAPTTTSYTVQVGGQTYRMEVICEALYTVYPIHFLNKYGGFETKLFTKVSRQSFDIVKTDFGKLPYTVDAGGNVGWLNNNNVYNETRSVYASQYTEKLTLNSDFINDGHYVWLADLVISPMIYIEDGGYFFPVVLSDTNYTVNKNVNDELTNLTINIEYGNQLNAQFR